MRLKTRGKLAAIGTLALGLTLVSAPAFAGEGEAPTLSIVSDTFAAGSWGDGVDFTVGSIPDDAIEINVYIGSMGENGGGSVANETFLAADVVDGSVSGNLTPDASQAPVAPNADGYPKYDVSASYTYEDAAGETKWENAESIALVITEGASVTGPETVTVSQLESSDGVELQFVGFIPNETLTGTIETWNATDGYVEIGTFTTTVGADGSGSGALWVTGAQVGEQIRVHAAGEESSVNYFTRVVAEPTTPTDPTEPKAPTAPERVETAA
ncbi:MAG: hypothetical protein ACTIJ6_01495 [Leucobacter sp.]